MLRRFLKPQCRKVREWGMRRSQMSAMGIFRQQCSGGTEIYRGLLGHQPSGASIWVGTSGTIPRLTHLAGHVSPAENIRHPAQYRLGKSPYVSWVSQKTTAKAIAIHRAPTMNAKVRRCRTAQRRFASQSTSQTTNGRVRTETTTISLVSWIELMGCS